MCGALKMRLTAVSNTFALVCAFLSPTNPDTASCSHFLPCLPNPRTSPYRNGCAGACALKRRETLVADADLSPLHARQVKVSRNMPKVDGAEARLARRKLRAVLGKDQTAGEVHAWCLEQNERLKHAISVALVHMRAFVVVETLSEGPNKAHGLKNRHWSLAQRSIPINTTLSVRYSPVHMGIYGISVLEWSRIAFRTKGFQCCGSATPGSPLAASCRILP